MDKGRLKRGALIIEAGTQDQFLKLLTVELRRLRSALF